jgi:hypothetical protein
MAGTPAHAASSQTLFTTQTPASLGQSDGTSTNYELGALLQSNTAGQITAIRFWKDSRESGTHTGRIWSGAGQLLASVTFANETASGWQQQALATPLAISANTTFVVSVNTGNTYYVATASGLSSQVINGNLSSVVGNNGVYGNPGTFPTNSWFNSNYFRDVVFVPGTTYSISGTIGPLASGPGTTVTLSGAASVTTTTDSSGNYTFTGLANGSYTVTPSKAGFTFSPANASASVNNSNVTVATFTATANATGQTLFTTQVPAKIGQSDGASANYELGALLQSNTAGQITAIRFWKDASESGTHTGHIWSGAGQSLASVTFANETASGWQQQALATPLAISANTTYVVSVNTGNTFYVVTPSGLASQVINGNLSSVVGNDGVHGNSGTFPTNSWQNSNYFRDVVFIPFATSMPPTITAQPSSKAITPGQTATFTVAATGTAPMTFQWMKNTIAISGATSSSYTTPAETTTDNNAQFTVKVSNSVGSANSNPATLTVTSGTLVLNASVSTLSFGNVNVSSTSSQNVTLTNAGTSSVTISNVSVSGAGFGASGVPAGLILSAGQPATLTVSFAPAATGSVTGSVTVTSNATNSPTKVTLSGTGLAAVVHSASLSWVASTSPVTGYNCYSSTVPGGPYVKLNTLPIAATSYTDLTVQTGKTYYYVVTSVNSNNVESAFSTQVSATIP